MAEQPKELCRAKFGHRTAATIRVSRSDRSLDSVISINASLTIYCIVCHKRTD